MIRSFVALEVSEPVRAELAKLIDELRRFNAPVKWVEPKNIHLTLKFLGPVPEDKAGRAAEILQACVVGVAPFQLEVKGAGGFPDLRRPRVLFVSAVDSPPLLKELAARIDKAMTELNVPREDRPFQNHITLGRVKMPRPMPDLVKRLEALADRSFGVTTVERIVLMRSDLGSAGPTYTRIAECRITAEGNHR